MADNADGGPLYFIEPIHEELETWRVVGPNGPVGDYRTEADAQAKADLLNEQVAEGTEDDF
jgi:hypothetical protein